jgi:hypothetical protein
LLQFRAYSGLVNASDILLSNVPVYHLA